MHSWERRDDVLQSAKDQVSVNIGAWDYPFIQSGTCTHAGSDHLRFLPQQNSAGLTTVCGMLTNHAQ